MANWKFLICRHGITVRKYDARIFLSNSILWLKNRFTNYMTDNTLANYSKISIWRRLAALSYDSFIVFCLWLLATAFIVPFTADHIIKPHNIPYQLLLILICFSFFCWFWMRGGQTIGMLAWRIKLVNKNKQPITFKQVIIRWLLAIPCLLFFGVGLLWSLLDKRGLSLHDRWSNTMLIVVE